MTKKDITRLSYQITGCAIKMHKALGPGLLESVYEKCLKYELIQQGYTVEQQLIVPVVYDNISKSLKPFVNEYFRLLPDE